MKTTLRIVCFALLFLAYTASAAVPTDAYKYRATLIREARAVYGMTPPLYMLAGQIHQESGWRSTAKSAYAAGLTQFTPDTATWISSLFKELGPADVYNPTWAIRALVRYDKMLYEQNKVAKTTCDQWAYALTGYNGGQGWNLKDRKKASALGKDPSVYWGVVEFVNSGRREDFFKENRGYPSRILLKHQPLYVPFFDTVPSIYVCRK